MPIPTTNGIGQKVRYDIDRNTAVWGTFFMMRFESSHNRIVIRAKTDVSWNDNANNARHKTKTRVL
jgi:hypothetical protein